MRRALAVLVLALALYLAADARFDPSLPFLFASGRLTWWCHGEPLSTLDGSGPYRLDFAFTPAAAGRLEVAAMSRFRLRSGEHVLLEGPVAPGRWKRIQSVEVKPALLVLEAGDDRRLPAIGLGGPAAPTGGVRVDRDGVVGEAVRARSLYTVRPALPDRQLAVAVGLIALLLAGFARLAWQAPAAAPPVPAARPVLVGAILVGHLALAAWNLSCYPLDRGLDAPGHVAYARAILVDHALPDPGAGFQTYHPPLYHLLGALALGVTGSERSLQALSAAAGVLLVLVLGRALGPTRSRGLALIAFAPVLLVAEPQATNEVLLALLAAAALAVAARAGADVATAGLAGLLAGLALLTKYTGLFVLLAVLAALLWSGAGAPRLGRRLLAAAVALATAIATGAPPYLERLALYGNPFVGNWDDALGHPYRQPPGVRMAIYFLRFGASFVSHPFKARETSLWDSLYVSLVGDGFGRMINTPAQHLNLFLLAWAALPLLLTTLWGFASIAAHPERASRTEAAGLLMTLLTLSAVVRYNLELPYWSAAKGVFLLVLALPVATAFERGRDAAIAAGGRSSAVFLDAALLVFAATSAVTFAYRA